jgi:hypothetical protein
VLPPHEKESNVRDDEYRPVAQARATTTAAESDALDVEALRAGGSW